MENEFREWKTVVEVALLVDTHVHDNHVALGWCKDREKETWMKQAYIFFAIEFALYILVVSMQYYFFCAAITVVVNQQGRMENLETTVWISAYEIIGRILESHAMSHNAMHLCGACVAFKFACTNTLRGACWEFNRYGGVFFLFLTVDVHHPLRSNLFV